MHVLSPDHVREGKRKETEEHTGSLLNELLPRALELGATGRPTWRQISTRLGGEPSLGCQHLSVPS